MEREVPGMDCEKETALMKNLNVDCEQEAPPEKNPKVFLDITVNGFHEGRIIVELFSHLCPRTAENFRALCTGEKGLGEFSGKPLHYKGTRFYRNTRGVMLEGGDVSNNDGTGGESIYGRYFEDEHYELGPKERRGHCRKGLLSIVRNEPGQNSSQFAITLHQLHYLDKTTIVFGRVTKGLGVVKCIERIPTDDEGLPLKEIVIANCGEIPDGGNEGLANLLGDGDMYYDYIADMDEDGQEDALWFRKAAESIKNIGNNYYKRGEYLRASKKYVKAIHYNNRGRDDEESATEVEKLKETLNMNLGFCHLKMGNYRMAQDSCHMVLMHNPDHVKANFCLGLALLAEGRLDEAEEALLNAARFNPKDTGIRSALADVKKKMDGVKSKERTTYAKMFGCDPNVQIAL